MKVLPKIKIDNGTWICEDDNGNFGSGLTPKEAWVEYQIKMIDKMIEVVYTYENV